MKIEENILILEGEITDEMLDEFIKLSKTKDLESIVIDTDNISSLILQQLFCISKDMKIICNDSFIGKFFDNIQFEAA
jgi:hypothetical protein